MPAHVADLCPDGVNIALSLFPHHLLRSVCELVQDAYSFLAYFIPRLICKSPTVITFIFLPHAFLGLVCWAVMVCGPMGPQMCYEMMQKQCINIFTLNGWGFLLITNSLQSRLFKGLDKKKSTGGNKGAKKCLNAMV